MTMNFKKLPTSQQGRTIIAAAKRGAEQAGYTVHRARNTAGAQIVELEKDGKRQRAAIRTTKDRWIAFVPLGGGTWKTLDDVDVVLVAALADREDGSEIDVHLFPADDVRRRFDSAFDARVAAGHQLKTGWGMWVALDRDVRDLAYSVGSGLADDYPLIARIAVDQLVDAGKGEPAGSEDPVQDMPIERPRASAELAQTVRIDDQMTIAEVLTAAREQIGKLAGVSPQSVKLDLKIEAWS